MAKRGKWLVITGIVLILLSLGSVCVSRIAVKNTTLKTSAILTQLDAVLPNPTPGIPGAYRITQMPSLQIEKQDVVAIVEIPALGTRLPVSGHWEKWKIWGIPRKFSGSVYDDSLIIGGNDIPGQFDCFDRIPNGAQVIVTDMSGAEFFYTVERIQRSDSAASDILQEGNADLTLFVRDTYAMEYLILRCVR